MRSLLLAAIVPALVGQNTSEVRIRVEADPPSLRPFESTQVQLKVYGLVAKANGEGSDTVRLNKGGGKARLVNPGCGMLSKAYKFQGSDPEPFYQSSSSRFANILGGLTKDFVLQDAFLFTASDRTGPCEIEAELDGLSVRATIQVDFNARSIKKQETNSFQAESRAADPYRYLAEHWSPMLAQETWFQPKSDMAARFDFDGDWHGDNNWDNLEIGSSQAYVYYAAMETSSHWFLVYNIFHPRDYSDKCIAGSCHENDNEGLILTIRKDGSEFGQLQVMETLAHNNVHAAVNDQRIRSAAHKVDGRIELHESSHPIAFIESGGHGVYPTLNSTARYRNGRFSAGTGITYVYKGVAERPRHPDDKLVGYELLPIYDHWWLRGTEGANWRDRTFDEFYAYAPFGGRPGVPAKWGRISGAFLGRKEASNKARPFWGWFDNATKNRKTLNNGQWGLDPAYSVSQGVSFPSVEQPSLDYTFNPYLGVE
jgi:hypothetical protein